ncbi:hypothetical protein RhiirC2_785433 [Rhizophagus irregularis]|uniref:Uncharacterized protein n=1 Tax=Rhizophagus irregularis TaxID=588596 RepID=A0A2N1MWE0_9GLOM|nr:hypothetical protein RhiirC2_785433 [Rhizophagus irregularis]
MSTRAPAPCPFRSGIQSEHVQYFNYQGNISKNIENIHVHVTSIVNGIDFTVTSHFGHAFGFKRSFYIDENLNYCLLRALEVMSNSELFKLRCLEDLQGDADADAGDST